MHMHTRECSVIILDEFWVDVTHAEDFFRKSLSLKYLGVVHPPQNKKNILKKINNNNNNNNKGAIFVGLVLRVLYTPVN